MTEIKVDFFDEIAQLCVNTSLLPLAINTEILVFRKTLDRESISLSIFIQCHGTDSFLKFM